MDACWNAYPHHRVFSRWPLCNMWRLIWAATLLYSLFAYTVFLFADFQASLWCIPTQGSPSLPGRRRIAPVHQSTWLFLLCSQMHLIGSSQAPIALASMRDSVIRNGLTPGPTLERVTMLAWVHFIDCWSRYRDHLRENFIENTSSWTSNLTRAIIEVSNFWNIWRHK